MSYYDWKPYVPVARRRAQALREMQKLRRKGVKIEPVEAMKGRKIARTFWGEAWCDHLEKFSDYENRLPRGRTYVRNGSVCHLAIAKGRIEAIVSGSELYNVEIGIKTLSAARWKKVRRQCAGRIGSMLELLQGRFSEHVMEIVTDRDTGLFPRPNEISLSCDCPDWAGLCKHLAAVLYAIGARLDQQPELLFLLRNVNHEELITADLDLGSASAGKGKSRRLSGQDLSRVFDVEIEEPPAPRRRKKAAKKKVAKKTAKKKIAAKKKRAAPAGEKPPLTGRRKRATGAPAAANRPFTPTSAAVARLRKRFGMTRSEFARLLGVSQPTVYNWENAGGKLNLRQRTLESLTRAAGLSPEQAKRKLRRR